ncbi:MAG: class I SAM-dependent methyltransferase [Staphylococcus sp.]|jgi:ribosomal protein L11 methyltransferase (prmA)|nr:class I SAM-dependent methyltransferase [Staphylococcus sp.]
MSNQYFENNVNLESNEIIIPYYFRGQKFNFITDNGVFSKKEVDFGSSLLLQTVTLDDGDRVLDVGCGYGVIGLVIAKVKPQSLVDMIDINERAIRLSCKNKTLNKIENVEIFVSNIYQNIVKKYDVIVSNPPIRAGKKIVHEIASKSFEFLNEDGTFWCVIQKKQGAESMLKLLIQIYQKVEIVEKDKGYWIIKAKK